MDPESLRAAITDKTKVVIPVDLYGHPADMDAINAIAAEKGITVIEDAAQAHGARYKGRRTGSLAPIATFSFYPGKNLGAYGDAGAVTLADEKASGHVTMLANHGRWEKYKHLIEGFNYRLDAIQAAVLQVKLKHLDAWTARRKELAAKYDALFADVAEVGCPQILPDCEHVYHLYVIQIPKRYEVNDYLRDHGVMSQIHYPIPLHLQPAYEYLGMKPGSLPVTESLAEKCVSVPCFPEMTDEQVEVVVATVKEALVKA